MEKNIKDDRKSVYELSYLLSTSIPEEAIAGENTTIRNLVASSGAEIIAEEVPHKEELAYSIRKKNVSGSYEKFDFAYFGWVKFEVETGKIEGIKKGVEVIPSVIRLLIITTVRENTYMGKRAANPKQTISIEPEKKEVAPATVEEMDKSIDEMVKEV